MQTRVCGGISGAEGKRRATRCTGIEQSDAASRREPAVPTLLFSHPIVPPGAAQQHQPHPRPAALTPLNGRAPTQRDGQCSRRLLASTFLTHTGGRADLELPPKTRRRISQTAHHPALRTRNGVTPAGESLITNAIPSVSNRLSVLLQTGAEIAMQSCCTANVHWNTHTHPQH